MTDQSAVTLDTAKPNAIGGLGRLLAILSIAALGAEMFAPEVARSVLPSASDDQVVQVAGIALLIGIVLVFIGKASARKASFARQQPAAPTAALASIAYPAPAPKFASSSQPSPSEDDDESSNVDEEDDDDDGDYEPDEEDVNDLAAEVLGRTEWARGEVTSNTGSSLLPLWLIAVLWDVISIPLAFFVTNMVNEGHWIGAIFYMFPLLGVLLTLAAIRTTLQYRKFGDSTLTIQDRCGVVGGAFTGVVRSKIAVDPLGDYAATIRCTESITTGSGKNRQTETKTRWENRQTIARTGCNILSGVPLSFQIPDDVPESFDRGTRGRIEWKVTLSTPVKGVDYEVQFEVPVLRKKTALKLAAQPGQ
ncbi:MAG: hypothetical protein U0136_10890 [Bdellovibrionota bacterium]